MSNRIISTPYSCTYFTNSTITDASLNAPSSIVGSTTGCIILQKTGSDISNNIFITNSGTTSGSITTYTLSQPITYLSSTLNLFAAPALVQLNGYITDLSFVVVSCQSASMIYPYMNITGVNGTVVTPGTFIRKYGTNSTGKLASGLAGTYIINNSQTVGSAASPVKFSCSPQPAAFICGIDASSNIWINQGNAYQSGGVPFLGMTLTGLTLNGSPINTVKIYNLAPGSPSTPFFDISNNYTSTPGQLLLTSNVDASGCRFRGTVSGTTITATLISFGVIKIGHFLSGSSNDRSSVISTPAPTVTNFIAGGSYYFTCDECNVSANSTILNINKITNPAYTIPNFNSSSPQFYIYISGKDASGNSLGSTTYWILGYSTNLSGKGETGNYYINKAIPGGLKKDSTITLTVVSTPANTGGGIGLYSLSSSQASIPISTSSYLITGPIISGSLQ